MTDTNAGAGTATAGTTDTSAATPTGTNTEADQQTTDKQEVDWKAKAREWEKRAKENSAAAARLAEFEESQKTEAQKAADRAATAELKATEAEAKVLRRDIALEHKLTSDDAALLDAVIDEGAMRALAARLAAGQTESTSTTPGPRPDLSQGARSGAGSQTGDAATDFATFLSRQLPG